jgi:hypothetical protein
MEAGGASIIVIVLALVCANVPFFTERVLGLIAWRAPRKPFWLRAVELLVLYGLTGLVAWALESAIGNVFPQRWEFYAITVCLFLVLAFPGFVWRYLRKSHG